MAAPVDPLGWVNENPLLLAIGAPLVVSAVSLFFRAARRWWWAFVRLIGRGLHWTFRLRTVSRERVRPRPRKIRNADLAPVRWLVRFNPTRTGALLANSAGGIARRVRIDDGPGTTVYGNGMWEEISGDRAAKFPCDVDEFTAYAESAAFRVRWLDELGEEHVELVNALPGSARMFQ